MTFDIPGALSTLPSVLPRSYGDRLRRRGRTRTDDLPILQDRGEQLAGAKLCHATLISS